MQEANGFQTRLVHRAFHFDRRRYVRERARTPVTFGCE